MDEVLPSPLTHAVAANMDSGEILGCFPPSLDIVSPGRSDLGSSIAHHGHSDLGPAELSFLAIILAAVKKAGFACHTPPDDFKLDIGWPTNVRHVAHVTFDRLNGFLGLPVEFQMEIPRRVPSASASVFGVSPESMQCSYDKDGNSIPTILLLLQERLYDQGGLKAEGVFRINAENSQEEQLRDQLNQGFVPYDIDVHCLAGLIKAWFRELPQGVLDSLSPEQVMQCDTEEQTLTLVKTLPPTQAALLNWGIDLMTDVVLEESFNKMNAHNIAMVFAPNMTQMADPLTALMHAVQVMNFLKTLILKTLRDRAEASLDPRPVSSCRGPSTGNGPDNATKEMGLGVSCLNNSTDDGHDSQGEEAVKDRPNIDKYLSARNPLTEMVENEKEVEGLSLNSGSDTLDNKGDGSNGRGPDLSKLWRSSPLLVTCKSNDLVINGKPPPGSESEKRAFVYNIFSRVKNLIPEGKDAAVLELLQFEALSTVPVKGNAKNGCLAVRIDQLIEGVEAW